jgi:hypothetical protein
MFLSITPNNYMKSHSLLIPALLTIISIVAATINTSAQQTRSDSTLASHSPSGPYPPLATFTADQDHDNMMKQLGIKTLRPGPNGDEKAPNHANYDESLANPYPNLPEVLTLKNGKKVTTADSWWKQRRPEIIEDLEREVYGRIPPSVPRVTWSVKVVDHEFLGFTPVIAKQLTGHLDNSAYPLIDVNIRMTLVLPANAKGPVPVLMMFARSALRDSLTTQQLIADGWGYILIDPGSIQADNGAGLTRGVIGLVNKGQPRKPEDWGALRAWSWGAARALDYLEASEPMVDAKHVGIEGVSRYGKAALVTTGAATRSRAVAATTNPATPQSHPPSWPAAYPAACCHQP